ncbi:hypothetical protein V8E36_008058 [Tilletia maclaganii]
MAHIPASGRLRQSALGSASSSSGLSFSSGSPAPPRRETNHLLQDGQTTDSSSSVWLPSFGLMFRILVIARLIAARFTIIADCDETYNYWEALHLLVFPPASSNSTSSNLLPFQTWEYAPQFAIRSYAYLLPYAGFAKVALTAMRPTKIDIFYLVRNVLAITSGLVEAKFCSSVAEMIHPRVAKYLFVLLLGATGMTSAATALLPSTFTMYTTTLALAYAFYPSRLPSPNSVPAPSNLTLTSTPFLCTFLATSVFALGAIVGWPFAIVLSVPFVIEEIFLPSGNKVPRSATKYTSFVGARLLRFVQGALLAGLVIGGITTAIDTLAYGRFTVVSLGIVIYNVLSSKRGAGPQLYGTEPASYYFANLGLAFNILLPLALASIPLLGLVALSSPSRLRTPARSFPLTSVDKEKEKTELVESSRTGLLLLRLTPFYLWLGLLTLQSHKEERFMFPAYPLLCFNAAVSIYFLRTLVESVMPTPSPAKNQRQQPQPSRLPSIISLGLILATTLISVLRTLHLQTSFNAPIPILEHFSRREAPKLIARAFPNTIQGSKQRARLASGLDAFGEDEDEEQIAVSSTHRRVISTPKALPSLTGLVNMTLLETEFGDGKSKPAPIRLCYGKEWYRFPGHFFVPHGVSVDFVKSEFRGILPKHYAFASSLSKARGSAASAVPAPSALESRFVRTLDRFLGWSWGLRDVTRTVQSGFNDMNREEPDRYVDIKTCDYLVDLDLPHRYASTSTDPQRKALEPRHAIDTERWTRVHCLPFLDTSASAAASRPRSSSSPLHRILTTLDRTLYIHPSIRFVVSGGLRALGMGRWESARVYGDYCLLRTTRKESWANRRGSVGSLVAE